MPFLISKRPKVCIIIIFYYTVVYVIALVCFTISGREECIFSCCPSCSEKKLLKAVLHRFEDRICQKWDSIALELNQGDLVKRLRKSPESKAATDSQKLNWIIHDWVESGCTSKMGKDGNGKDVPVNSKIEVFAEALRADHVGLDALADECTEVRKLFTCG